MDIEFGETEFAQDDLVCSICDAEFLDKEDLEVHITQFHLNVHTKKRFCKLCTHIYPDVHAYALHIRNNHLSELKSCKYCFMLFKSIPEVQDHEKKHKAGILYPRICCSQCNKVFDSKDAVRNHELNEHSDLDDGMFFKSCLSIMSSVLCMNITDFLAAAHNNLVYVCTICNKKSLDVKEYIQHLIESKCSSYTCDQCCNVFKNKYKVAKHIVTHTSITNSDILNRQCPKCRMTLKKTPLRLHVRSCTGVTCKQCELTFKSVGEYTNHRLSEHNTNSLSLEVCIYCQRQMVGADTMKKHIERAHGKDKHLYKYHCTDCDKIFKHPKLLFTHFYSRHKDLQPYTCQICSEKFRIRKNFTLHIKLKHKSIGFVEFDDNFHVFFTDKKSVNKPNENESNIEQDTTNNHDTDDESIDKSQNISNNKTNFESGHNLTKPISNNNESNLCRDDQNGEKTVSLGEGELQIEINQIERNVIEHTYESNDIMGIKSNDKEVSDRNNEKIDEMTTDCEDPKLIIEKPIKKILKRKRNATKKIVVKASYDTSSDDSDEPLKLLSKKMKRQKKKKRNTFDKVPLNRPKKKKFYCNKCDRNCYTYQNYHRHLALHTKNETKVCIKCFGKFDSVKKLNEHIKNEHSSSQLTETLKKLIEKRKKAEEKTKVIPNKQTSEELPENVDVEISKSEKFRNTIKKVNIERNTAKVTMKLIDKDKISVKKFLESFNPENNEVKITMLKTVDQTAIKKLRPLIKLTKVNTEPVVQNEGKKLKMPVKFTDRFDDKCHVNIKLTTDYVAPKMTFSNPIYNNNDFNDQNHINTYDDYDDRDFDNEADTKDVIPDVAQEVMLEVTDEPNNVVHNVRTIKNLPLPAWNKVQVATLSTEAPYFKITKINLDNKKPFKFHEEEPEENVPKEVILPNGKKLVSANPYAHILDNKKIDELLNVKKKKAYYKPKLSNVAQALSKAMENINKHPPVKVKKEKKNV